MASLKKIFNDLEDEKKSLLTVIKMLQTNVDQNTSNDGGWLRTKGNMSQKHRTADNTRKNEIEIANKYEIFRDSDMNPVKIPNTQSRKKGKSPNYLNVGNKQGQINRPESINS